MLKKSLIIACFIPCLLGGQEIPDPLRQPFAYCRYYPRHFSQSLRYVTDLNYHRDLLITGFLLIPAAFVLDEPVHHCAVEQGLYSRKISRVGDKIGYRWGYYGAAGFVLTHGFVRRQPFRRTFAQVELLASGVITTGIVTGWIKFLTHRQRPDGSSYTSFPSGHTSGSFALAAGLAEIYGSQAGSLAYLLAAFVASSRINDNKHYLSDVVAGACLGTLIGRSFARQHRFEWQTEQTLQGERIGIKITMRL